MSEVRIGGQSPRELREGLPDGARGGNQWRGLFWARDSEISARTVPNRLPIPCPRLSLGHDRPFPVPEHLFGAAGELFRPRGPDPRRRPPADQAEPGACRPSRARSGRAGEPGRRRNPRRQAPPRRRRPDRDGLCRPPVRPFRAPARRRPGHPARRGHRQGRRPPRHPAQGIGPDAVLAPGRRPRRARAGPARIHRQRGDVRAGHPDHPLAGRGDVRRARAARDHAARRGAHAGGREPYPRRHLPVLCRARRNRWRSEARRPRHRQALP